MKDPVALALKLDELVQQSDCDEETRRRAIEFVWFYYCGRFVDWSLVRIPRDAKRQVVR